MTPGRWRQTGAPQITLGFPYSFPKDFRGALSFMIGRIEHDPLGEREWGEGNGVWNATAQGNNRQANTSKKN